MRLDRRIENDSKEIYCAFNDGNRASEPKK